MDLSNELVNMFLDWGSTSSGSSSASNFNSFLESNSNGSSSFGMIERRSKVKHTMLALKKCKKLSSMGDIYRDKLCDTIRVTVRTTVNECASDAAKDISIARMKTNNESENGDDATTKPSVTHGATSMSFEQFMSCLNMCFEQILSVLQSAAGVNHFCLEEGFAFRDEDESSSGTKVDNENSTSPNALLAAANLSHKSISELLRLRKEAHSLVTFEEMKRLWDASLAFTLQVERFSGQKAYGLRSTLRAQATAFVERQHESNMSRLVAALNSEKWSQSDVSLLEMTDVNKSSCILLIFPF
jgi:vacuolar protein sorting-associated protein 54